MNQQIKGAIFGFVVGDALGVPVEFKSRVALTNNPVIDMQEYGTYHQPKGTWSDDTTMTLCLMESLIEGLDYDKLYQKFSAWVKDGYLTPHNELFDIGIATRKAISNFQQGLAPLSCGGSSEYDNGNGSLMRILPLVFYTMGLTNKEKVKLIEEVSMLTHAHIRSKIACVFYVQYGCELLKGYDKEKAYRQTISFIEEVYAKELELKYYDNILNNQLKTMPITAIKSSGYVVDTLEALMWCFLNTNSYEECVLKAVNLGEDTDTIAALAGGLAGLYYGYDNINTNWLNNIVKYDLIDDLCNKFSTLYQPFKSYDKLIKLMENTNIKYDYYNRNQVCIDYMNLTYNLGYMDYEYVSTIDKYRVDLNDINSIITDANTELLLAINTYLIRQERFNEGTLEEYANNGVFIKIIKRLTTLANNA